MGIKQIARLTTGEKVRFDFYSLERKFSHNFKYMGWGVIYSVNGKIYPAVPRQKRRYFYQRVRENE